MKLTQSLTAKVNRVVDHRVRQALDRVAGHSACAGIKDSPDNAKKARINHHGGPNLQARRFVYAPIGGDGIPPEYYRALRTLIKEEFAKGDLGGTYSRKTRLGDIISYKLPTIPFGTYERDEEGNLTGASERKTGYQVLMQIAKEMAEMQKDIINSRLLAPNKPSTIKNKERKGRRPADMPLVEYGKLRKAIQGWVE